MPVLLEVGRIGRAHGLRGEVSVRLSTDRTERLDAGSVLHTPRGPLTVASARPHQDRWIVHFEGIDDRTAAETWHGTVLSAEALGDPDALFVHDLVGSRVVDGDGRDRGVVVSVISNPASDLMELDGGALVPLTFVVGGAVDGTVRVDVPDGLFELYEPD